LLAVFICANFTVVWNSDSFPGINSVFKKLPAIQRVACQELEGSLAWFGLVVVFSYIAGVRLEVVTRKMRLLTLAALCTKTQIVDFSTVSEAIQVPKDDVEAWVIDGNSTLFRT
jgi:hypothetical protein